MTATYIPRRATTPRPSRVDWEDSTGRIRVIDERAVAAEALAAALLEADGDMYEALCRVWHRGWMVVRRPDGSVS